MKNYLLASRRTYIFVALVLVVLGMGVLGLFPNNSLEILSPFFIDTSLVLEILKNSL
jgi:hypothetical protein